MKKECIKQTRYQGFPQPREAITTSGRKALERGWPMMIKSICDTDDFVVQNFLDKQRYQKLKL